MSTLKKSHRIITAPQPMTCGEQPLTGLDVGMPVEGFCIALVYPRPLDDTLLIASLQKALDRSPYFAGRLFGIGSTLPLAIPNNEGTLFTCIEYAGAMPQFSIDQPLKPHLSRFAHCIPRFGFDHHTPLLQVQLTNFTNGCILGISISHALCDGTAMIDFMQSWACHAHLTPPRLDSHWNRRDVQQMAMGDGLEASVQLPVFELNQPLTLNAAPVETAIFRLSTSILEQLDQKYRRATDESSREEPSCPAATRPNTTHQNITLQDIVMAFLYLLLQRCSNAAPADHPLSIVCNIRRLLELPAAYLGNAVRLRHLQPDAHSLRNMDVRAIALQIRALHAGMTARDLRRDLAFWQKRTAEGTAAQFIPMATYLALKGGILIDNMSKFNFYELDFGCGRPVWIDTPPPPAPAPITRGVLMLPAPPEEGGIDIHVSLLPAEMANLRSLMMSAYPEGELLPTGKP